MDGAGGLHVVYEVAAEAGWTFSYVHLPAGGAWSAPERPDPAISGAPRPQIAADASGGAHIAYRDDGLTYIHRSGEGLFSSPTVLDTQPDAFSIATDASGGAHILYALWAGLDVGSDLYYAYRSPTDASWNERERIATARIRTLAAAVDDSGLVHVVGLRFDEEPPLYWQRPAGEAWTEQQAIDAVPSCSYGDLALDGSGTVHLACSTAGLTSPQTSVVHLQRSTAGAWSADTVAPADASFPHRDAISIATDENSRVHVVFAESSDRAGNEHPPRGDTRLRSTHRSVDGDWAEPATLVEGGLIDLGDADLVVDRDECAHLVYWDRAESGTRYSTWCP